MLKTTLILWMYIPYTVTQLNGQPQLQRVGNTNAHVEPEGVFGSPLRLPKPLPVQTPPKTDYPQIRTQFRTVSLNISSARQPERSRIRQKQPNNERILNAHRRLNAADADKLLTKEEKEEVQQARKRAFIQRLDANVDIFMKKYQIEGLSLAIAVPKGVRVERAYGWANVDRRERMSPHHMLRLASLTKPITSVAILKLVEIGRLSLDERVFGPKGVLGHRYGLPPYGYFVRMITVRHLLEHSAGWASNPAEKDPVGLNPDLSRTELINYVLNNVHLTKPPGTVFQYSNFGYLLLGRVIEVRSGMLYENFVKKYILDRCGAGDMTNSDFWPGREPMYYSGEGSPYTFPLTRADSALGWVSTAADYLRFVLCIDGWPQQPDVLNRRSIKQMITPSKVHDAYGLGWSFNLDHDWWHSGSMPGCASYIEKYRTGLMWVVMTNRRHEMHVNSTNTQISLLQFESDLSHVISKGLF